MIKQRKGSTATMNLLEEAPPQKNVPDLKDRMTSISLTT